MSQKILLIGLVPIGIFVIIFLKFSLTKILIGSALTFGVIFFALSRKGDSDKLRKRSVPRNRTAKLVYCEPESEEYFPAFSDIEKLDFTILSRSRAFQCLFTSNYQRDVGDFKKEYLDEDQKQLRPFFDQPDVLPV